MFSKKFLDIEIELIGNIKANHFLVKYIYLYKVASKPQTSSIAPSSIH